MVDDHRSAVVEAKAAWDSYQTLVQSTDLDAPTIQLAIEAAWKRYEAARTKLDTWEYLDHLKERDA